MPFFASLIGIVGPKLSTGLGLLKNYWFAYKWVIIISILLGYGLYCVRFGYKMSENEHAAAVAETLIERDKLQKKVIDEESQHSLDVIKLNEDRKAESTALKSKLAIAIANANKAKQLAPVGAPIDCNPTKEEIDAIGENIDAANRALTGGVK